MLGRQARRVAILSRTSVPTARPKGPFAASVVSPCITSRSLITESTLVVSYLLGNFCQTADPLNFVLIP